MAGFYHLALFLFRRKDKSALYFGIFGVLIAFRTLFVGESFAFFAFPELSFSLTRKIQTLTYYLGIPVAFLFFREILPLYFHKIIAKITLIIVITSYSIHYTKLYENVYFPERMKLLRFSKGNIIEEAVYEAGFSYIKIPLGDIRNNFV